MCTEQVHSSGVEWSQSRLEVWKAAELDALESSLLYQKPQVPDMKVLG